PTISRREFRTPQGRSRIRIHPPRKRLAKGHGMTNSRTGARYLAEYLKAREVSHVFFMDAILRSALIEMHDVGIARVLAHSEAGAAYMADGFARTSGRPGICMAQSVGAANLAAALQDACLHRSPVIAITGHKAPPYRIRHAYQEVPHGP